MCKRYVTALYRSYITIFIHKVRTAPAAVETKCLVGNTNSWHYLSLSSFHIFMIIYVALRTPFRVNSNNNRHSHNSRCTHTDRRTHARNTCGNLQSVYLLVEFARFFLTRFLLNSNSIILIQWLFKNSQIDIDYAFRILWLLRLGARFNVTR